MTIMPEDVRRALAPLLGETFVSVSPVCAHAAQVLSAFVPGSAPLDTLLPALRDAIFGDLFAALGESMVLTLPDGRRLRLRLKDVETLADEALGLLMEPCVPRLYGLADLRRFAMDHDSLSAIRIMLQYYGSTLAPMEKEMWARVARENHPRERWQTWLQG